MHTSLDMENASEDVVPGRGPQALPPRQRRHPCPCAARCVSSLLQPSALQSWHPLPCSEQVKIDWSAFACAEAVSLNKCTKRCLMCGIQELAAPVQPVQNLCLLSQIHWSARIRVYRQSTLADRQQAKGAFCPGSKFGELYLVWLASSAAVIFCCCSFSLLILSSVCPCSLRPCLK